jgi:HK97 family phage major capsid protein
MDTVTRKRYLDQCGANLQKRIDAATTTSQLEALAPECERLAAEYKKLEWEKQNGPDSVAAKLRYSGADSTKGCTPPSQSFDGRKPGREANPLAFRAEDFYALYKSMGAGQNMRIKSIGPDQVETKAFSTVDPLLPAQLFPSVIAAIHENRLLDRLPVISMSAPSMEFLKHTSNTGGPPAITSEGALKPDITLNFVQNTVTAEKIACTFGLSWETLMDFPALLGYATQEIFKQVTDVENAALLNGSSGIVGFQQTAGILTLAYSTGAYLDVFSQGVENLRTGTSLAVADLIVMHPGTFGAVKRQKDSSNRYLLVPDPTDGQISDIWGVPVLQTTAAVAGTALLLDSTKFGFVPVRQNIEIQSGFTNDDFSRNIIRWAVEERLNLAVERPSAILNITGLPTS